MAEVTFSDFSGGMNALAAVDKCDPKECLIAENVRLDETGNIQSSGAVTSQNAPFTANVHSLYWNPSLGCVAGVGTNVFQGPTLSTQTSALVGQNLGSQKMSFASAPNRVYFDVASKGYWSDINNLITVDWQPPSAIGATITTGTPGTAVQTAGVGNTPWSNPTGINSSGIGAAATCSFPTNYPRFSYFLQATMSTSSFAITSTAVTGIAVSLNALTPASGDLIEVILLKSGTPVGNYRIQTVSAPGVSVPYTFGGSSDLWGTTWAQADINSGSFGFQVNVVANGGGTCDLYGATVTIYQGAGFVAAAGTAGTLTGTYTWKVTFVAANGEESDASNDSNSVNLTGSQGTLTAIQTGDARTVARNIYRKGGALTSHYLVGTIQDNATTTYSDNQSDLAALTVGVILAGDVPGDYPNSRLGSVQVRFPELHYDRVFWINQAKPYQIIWSKPLNGFAYPSINQINVGDSKPITRLVSIFGELIIVKTDSIWRLTGTDEASFELTQTPSAIGTDEPFTVVKLPDKVPFHNRYGFWVFNGYTSVPLTNKLDLWMKQENRTNKSIFVGSFVPPEVTVQSVYKNFEAVANSEKYYLAYAEAGQPLNNSILVFDLKHGNITKRPYPALSMAIDPVNGFVYMGQFGSNQISLLDDWNGINANGLAANFNYQHGYQDLQRGSNKALWALEFYLNTNGQTLTPSVAYDNGLVNETLQQITTTGLQRVVRQVQAGRAREMQNFSWAVHGALNSVNNNGTPQVQIVHVKALYDLRVGRARTGLV